MKRCESDYNATKRSESVYNVLFINKRYKQLATINMSNNNSNTLLHAGAYMQICQLAKN